jgi:hypothetical protein
MTSPDQPDDAPVPMLRSLAWQQAEARLYPAVTSRPDVYQRAVRIVALLVGRLRLLGTSTSALLAAADRGPELVVEVLTESGMSGAELDLALLAEAALAMRHREVVGAQATARRLRTLSGARQSGQDWVVVEEQGYAEGDPFVPYHRLEVEVSTGRALFVTATATEDYTDVIHAVEVLRVDLVTGSVEESDEGAREAGVSAASLPSSTARDALAAALRAGSTRA